MTAEHTHNVQYSIIVFFVCVRHYFDWSTCTHAHQYVCLHYNVSLYKCSQIEILRHSNNSSNVLHMRHMVYAHLNQQIALPFFFLVLGISSQFRLAHHIDLLLTWRTLLVSHLLWVNAVVVVVLVPLNVGSPSMLRSVSVEKQLANWRVSLELCVIWLQVMNDLRMAWKDQNT